MPDFGVVDLGPTNLVQLCVQCTAKVFPVPQEKRRRARSGQACCASNMLFSVGSAKTRSKFERKHSVHCSRAVIAAFNWSDTNGRGAFIVEREISLEVVNCEYSPVAIDFDISLVDAPGSDALVMDLHNGRTIELPQNRRETLNI